MDLIYLNGEQSGNRCPLTPPGISIGREEDNDLQLSVTGVSGYHAMLSFDGQNWYIEDLGSTNGTFVNSQKISEKIILVPGSEIGIGEQLFQFGENQTVAVEQEPSGTVEEENTEKNETGDLASQIRKSRYSIFSGAPENKDKAQGKNKKSRLGNLIFTLLVITLPLVCIFVYMMVVDQQNKDKNKGKIEPRKQPFLLCYEKKITTPDNVFRFEARIEDNLAILTVDDLRYGRHFVVKKNNVKPKEIEILKDSIRRTEFMKAESSINNFSMGSEDRFRQLSIFIDGTYNSVSVRNTNATRSFEEVETAISDFALNYNMRTGILTAEEMREEANEFFKLAMDRFANYQASPKNLRDAITYFKNAKSYFEQFEPKPREWNICRKELDRAQSIYKAMFKDLHFNIQKNYKLNRPKEASQECSKMLELLDPESAEYQKYRNYKIEFDRRLKLKKK